MAIAALAHAGDNVVSSSNLYGGTFNQLKVMFPRLGIQTKFVSAEVEDPQAFDNAIDDQTKAVYLETIGNPRCMSSSSTQLVDIYSEAFAD